MKNIASQRGVVLILALFFLALATTLSYWMISRVSRETRSVELLLHNVQANLYAQGSIAWAKEILRDNLMRRNPSTITDDPQSMASPVEEKNNYQISTIITDMQANFNINNLNNLEWQLRFKKLLTTLLPELEEQKINDIIKATIDWISVNANTSNEYQTYYLTQKPAYRSANRVMQSISEWRLVKGVTPEIYEKVAPYLVALPQGTQINILTAKAPVIASLNDTLTIDAALVIEKTIKTKKIINVQQFLDLDIVKNNNLSEQGSLLTDISEYFLTETHVTQAKQKLVIYSLLERKPKENNTLMRIIWQSLQVSG